MTSKYFSHKNSLSEAARNDPTKESFGDQWFLTSHNHPPFVWVDDTFTNEELERIIVIGERLSKKRAETQGCGEDCLEIRRSLVSWVPINNITNWIYKRITDIIIENNSTYYNYDLTYLERLQFTYYSSKEQGCYNKHIDPLQWNLPHNRKLSFVMQLSDPSEYEGGELLLHNSMDPITIEKRKGRIILFPSYTLHEVTPVTQGERYSLVNWVHGPLLR